MKLLLFKLIGFIQERQPAEGYVPPRVEPLPGFNEWSQDVLIRNR